MIIEISVAIIALAFVALVIFLIKVLQSAAKSLDNVSSTLVDVQKTIEELTYEVKQTIRNVNDITVDVEHKLKQVDPLMETVKNLGEILNEVTLSTKDLSTRVIEKVKHIGESNPKAVTSTKGVSNKATASTPQQRTLQSYSATYSHSASTNWMRWVDTAATVWQRYRK